MVALKYRFMTNFTTVGSLGTMRLEAFIRDGNGPATRKQTRLKFEIGTKYNINMPFSIGFNASVTDDGVYVEPNVTKPGRFRRVGHWHRRNHCDVRRQRPNQRRSPGFVLLLSPFGNLPVRLRRQRCCVRAWVLCEHPWNWCTINSANSSPVANTESFADEYVSTDNNPSTHSTTHCTPVVLSWKARADGCSYYASPNGDASSNAASNDELGTLFLAIDVSNTDIFSQRRANFAANNEGRGSHYGQLHVHGGR